MSIHYPNDPKVITFHQAQALIQRARENNLETILAQGVFDIIHVGHTAFLKGAKNAANLLFVGLEPDESARMNKGSGRPFNPIEERLQLMADLQCVDYVFAFEDAAPYGPLASEFYEARLRRLMPHKLALTLGDPFLALRKENADNLGIEPYIVTGVWRDYSTTKLLATPEGA